MSDKKYDLPDLKLFQIPDTKPDPEVVAYLKAREAEKWDHQTHDKIISDPEMILRHLKRVCPDGVPTAGWLSMDDVGFAFGPGPTMEGLRYDLDVLIGLRDEGNVTSWKDLRIYVPGNAPSKFTRWLFGEWQFDGPGVLNGEEQE